MNKELVLVDGNKAYTTTLIIAEGCNVEHASTMKLLNTHKKEEILSRFEIRKLSRGGRPIEYVILDELQTTFLITLMKNSVPVVKFKANLSKAFFKQRQIISNLISQRTPLWENVRSDGKKIYLQKTDIIKEFVEYAINQGSKNARHYYENLAQMENKALFFFEQKYKNMREVLTIKQLMQISTADDVIDKALKEGMEKSYPYKKCYELAKSRIISFSEIIGQSPVLALELKNDKLLN